MVNIHVWKEKGTRWFYAYNSTERTYAYDFSKESAYECVSKRKNGCFCTQEEPPHQIHSENWELV